jgi:hypothetical protein
MNSSVAEVVDKDLVMRLPRMVSDRLGAFARKPDGAVDPLIVGLALAVGAAFFRLLVITVSRFGDPIIDWHSFRQTQTAISVRSILEGGPWLFYETPIFGAPWSIPFEAPIYHWTVALVVAASPLSIDDAGRLVSLAYLLGAIVLGARILMMVAPTDRLLPLIFALLTLCSAQYLFWGGSFLIETCAIFFGSLFVFGALRFYRSGRLGAITLAALGSIFCVLTKATTWPAFVAAFGVCWFADSVRARRVWALRTCALLAIGVASLALITWWNHAADALKEQNPFGALVTSKALSEWNFGALQLRFSEKFWRDTIYVRALPEAVGYFWPVLILVGTHVARPSVTAGVAAFGVFLYFLPMLLFSNLHVVHSYYQVANAVFLTAAAAALVAGAIRAERVRVALGSLVVLVAGQHLYFERERRPFLERAMTDDLDYRAAQFATRATPANSALVSFGFDWSSSLHYLAGRRGLAPPTWVRPEVLAAALSEPVTLLGDVPLGGVLDCRPVGSRLSAEADLIADEFITRFSAHPGVTRLEGEGCVLFVDHSATSVAKTVASSGLRND